VRGWLADERVRDRLRRARVDAGKLDLWFRDTRPEVLNTGASVAATGINTDLFPRDEYYLNRQR